MVLREGVRRRLGQAPRLRLAKDRAGAEAVLHFSPLLQVLHATLDAPARPTDGDWVRGERLKRRHRREERIAEIPGLSPGHFLLAHRKRKPRETLREEGARPLVQAKVRQLALPQVQIPPFDAVAFHLDPHRALG